jgi:hypothetical protein
MSASTDVPVTITPGAEARIAELGMRKEFEQMIAFASEITPGLKVIEVSVNECYDTRDETGISIEAISDKLFQPEERTNREKIVRRIVDTFPPQVLEHFLLLFSPWNANAR